MRGGKILGEGFHRRAGEAHAEVLALREAGRKARGATLYLTLEPCCTFGRTPPCTDAILRAGIRRVVVGAMDPNPKHAGRGLKILRNAGVAVRFGIMKAECERLNEAFNKWITTGIPFVVAKAAMTLDGKIADKNGLSRWITSRPSRVASRRLRAQADAILIGAGTLRADDPRLTLRSSGVTRKQPWRVILTRRGRLPRKARVFTDRWRERTLVFRKKNWSALLRDLAAREITRVLIEGGGETLASAFAAGVVDKVEFFYAPKLCGGTQAITAVEGRGLAPIPLERVRWRKIGEDLLLEAYVQRNR